VAAGEGDPSFLLAITGDHLADLGFPNNTLFGGLYGEIPRKQ